MEVGFGQNGYGGKTRTRAVVRLRVATASGRGRPKRNVTAREGGTSTTTQARMQGAHPRAERMHKTLGVRPRRKLLQNPRRLVAFTGLHPTGARYDKRKTVMGGVPNGIGAVLIINLF